MDYEEWIETYKPIQNHLCPDAESEGKMFETYGKEREFILAQHEEEPGKVWTLVQGDDDSWIIIDGFHYVNRIGYFVTEAAYEGDYLEILVCEADKDENPEDNFRSLQFNV